MTTCFLYSFYFFQMKELYPASVLTTNVMLVQASWRISRAVAQSIKVVINMYSMCWMFTKRFVINTRIFNTHMLKLTYTINTDRHKIAAAVWAQQKVCFLQFYFSVVNHQGQQGLLCWLLTVTFDSFSPRHAASSRICTQVFHPNIFQTSCVVFFDWIIKKSTASNLSNGIYSYLHAQNYFFLPFEQTSAPCCCNIRISPVWDN